MPLCNLYVSMLQRFGVETDRFGTSTGTLTDWSSPDAGDLAGLDWCPACSSPRPSCGFGPLLAADDADRTGRAASRPAPSTTR